MTAPSPTPRAIVGPLLLALFFLAIIGGSAGFVLALRADKSDSTGTDGANGRNTPPTGDQGQPQQPGQTPEETETSAPPRQPEGRLCPSVTQDAAMAAGSPGSLVTELYIRTRYSQVWICRDSAGALWYQGNRHNGDPRPELPAATSDDTLFRGGVSLSDRTYTVANSGENGTTYYRVSPERLVIDNPGDGQDSFEDAIPGWTYRR